MIERPPRLARWLLAVLLPADERRAVLRDLDDELARHVSPERGPRAARHWYWRQVFGSIRPALAMRGRRSSGTFGRTASDIRFALRALRRRPALTVAAIATLTLGIGANTAIFSVVDTVVLRPLPYHEPERLVRIWSANPRGIPRNSVSPPDYFDFEEQGRASGAFMSISAFTQGDTATAGGLATVNDPSRVIVSMVSPNLFGTLQVWPSQGRAFAPADAVDGALRVAILSERFASTRGVSLGSRMNLDDDPVTVVGIMPSGFGFPSPAVDLWVPMRNALRERSRSGHYLEVVARLNPPANLDGATDVLRTVAARLETAYPATNRGWGVTLVPLHESVTGDVKRPLLVLLAAVGCVLLIACANVAGLLLANGHERARELSLRVAIGASRGRLIGQQLIESLLLATGGAVGAVVVAQIALSLLQQTDGFALPRAESIALDLRVLAVTAGITLLTGVLCGVAPAIRASRSDPEMALKGARAAGPAAPARRLRAVMVAAQIAITLCLCIGAGLLMRSLGRLLDVDAGFDASHAVVAQVTLARSRYEPDRWVADVARSLDELRTLPGVTAVGAGSPLPLAGQQGLLRFGVRIDGQILPPDGRSDRAYLRWVTPGYFEAIGIPLISGRAFENHDDARGIPVAVVDRTFVQRYFPGEQPIGRRIQMTNERMQRQIVGVVGAVRQTKLEDGADPHVYIPHAQNPSPVMSFVVRTAGDPAALATPVRERLRTVDPSRPVYNVTTVEDLVAGTVAPRRFNALLVTLFALLAGMLTVVGMYGLMAGWVAESRKEFGVRLALGAERRAVLGLVVRRALLITAVGIAAGLPVALASTRIVGTMLFGIGGRDLPTVVGSCAVLLAVGLVGAYLPARRAIAVNPVDSLRGDF